LETLDNGKLIREMRAQLDKVPEYYYFHAGLADKVQGAVIPPFEPGSFAYTLKEPLGVVGAIVPWNSPLLLTTYKLAPALATGNTIVIKPSEHASAAILELMQLIDAAGFPRGVVNVVTGDGAAGHALASHPGVDKVAFTGGSATGRKVGQAAASHCARVTLELGGKSPQLIFPDADPQRAAAGIVSGIFAAAGQTCIAGSRAYLHAALYDEVCERIIQYCRDMTMGDPLDEATDIGPLCFEGHRTRVEEFVAGGADDGAEILIGGARPTPERRGWFYLPTVLGGVQNSMTVARDEIFGPVLCVFRWEDEARLIRDANDSPYALAAGIWCNDVARVHRVASKLDAGTVWVNQYRASNPLVPFGGFKQSGIGKENGTAVIDEYVRLKTVWIKTSGTGPSDPFVIQK
jgi:aldehyde dehydrogenase (NAD+)